MPLNDTELITAVNDRFLGVQSQYGQRVFKKLNTQLFDNSLPNILIIVGRQSSGTVGTFYQRFITIDQALFGVNFETTLLHEMQHYKNHLNHIDDRDHKSVWRVSLQHLHEKLNIPLSVDDLSDSELRRWPSTFFNHLNEIEPLTDGHILKRQTEQPQPSLWVKLKIKLKTFICKGLL